MDQRQWLYHAVHPARIFENQKAVDVALDDGWQDSPAKCKGFLDKIGVDASTVDALQLQGIGDVVEQTATVVNLLDNIDTLDRQQLFQLAKLQFGEDWMSKRLGLKKLRIAVRKRLER